MKITLSLLLLCLFNFSCKKREETLQDVFSFHLMKSIKSLNPQNSRGVGAKTLLNNLYRPLMKINEQGKTTAYGAQSCTWNTSLELRCRLKNFYFSNGKKVVAQDYVRGMHNLFKPESPNPFVYLLKNIAGFENAFKNHKAAHLKIEAFSETELRFIFKNEDAEFINKLTHLSLIPFQTSDHIGYSGAFQVSKQTPSSLILSPHPYNKVKNQPTVQIYFIESENTALDLFKSQKLSIMRQLMTTEFHLLKKYPYKKTKQFRLDSLLFVSDSMSSKPLRQALSYALDYRKLQSLYKSEGLPGCPNLPKEFYNSDLCLNFAPKKAKLLFESLSDEIKNRTYHLAFSGGEDLKRGMEWVAFQWKKHLGVKFEIHSLEPGVFMSALKNKKYDVFRKSIYPQRYSCHGALELFHKDSPLTYLAQKSALFNNSLQKLETSKDMNLEKTLCTESLILLRDSFSRIPLGHYITYHLTHNDFKNWFINPMDQLDLSGLQKNGE